MAQARTNELSAKQFLMQTAAVLALLVLGSTASVVLAANNSTSIKFLLMVASGSSPDSSAVVPSVDQTLEEINRDTSILPEHHLEYILRDMEVYIMDNRTSSWL